MFWIAFEGPSLERQKIETPVHVQVKDDRGAGAVVFGRGLAPLPGIELAPRAPGPDLRQWGLVLSLTAAALGVGYLASTWLQAP